MLPVMPALAAKSATVVDGNLKYIDTSLFTFTRPYAAYGWVDSNLVGFPANSPRFVDTQGGGYGLLLERGSTNETINARAEGSVPGLFPSVGQLPTDFASFTQSSLTLQIIGSTTVQGVPGLTMRLYGTTTNTYAVFVSRVNSGAGIATSGGIAWCSSLYFQRLSGTWAGITANVGFRETGGAQAVPGTSFAPSGSLERQYAAGTTTTGVTGVWPAFGFTFPNATAVDFTFFIGGFQAEKGNAPTSLMLPLPGAPLATSRAADTLVATNISGLIPDKTNWAVLVDWTPASAASSTQWPTTVSLNSPGPAQRFTAFTRLGTRQRFFQAWYGGQNDLAISTYVDNIRRREIVGVSGGTLRASADGAAVVSASYSMATANLDRLYIGSIGDGANYINGPIQRVDVYPACPSDAQMQAATTQSSVLLVTPQAKALGSLLSFTRPYAAYGWVDSNLVGFAANTPRFVDNAGGGYALLGPESQRTNIVVDATTGMSPGGIAAPNTMANSTDIASIGVGYLVTKHTHVSSDTNIGYIGAYYLTASTNYAMSIYVWLSSSQNYGINPFLGLSFDGAAVDAIRLDANFTLRDQWQLIYLVGAPTSNVSSIMCLRSNIAIGSFVYSCAPQHEQGGYPTSRIKTTSGAVTRAAESISATGTNFQRLFPDTGNWAMLFEVTMDRINDAGNFINFLDMADPAYKNRNVIYIEPNSRNIATASYVAGVGAGNFAFASYTDGVKFRVAVTRNAGRMAVSFNNGAIFSHTNAAGAPAGINQVLFGNNNVRGFDRIHRMELKPFGLTDAQLLAWV